MKAIPATHEPVDVTNIKKDYSTRVPESWGNNFDIRLIKEWGLKYGENPNQSGAIYRLKAIDETGKSYVLVTDIIDISSVRSDGKGKGGLSLTNVGDITQAAWIHSFFRETPAVAIMKHILVSGFARQYAGRESLADIYRTARDADLLSNFGGTAAFNRPLDMETAQAMYELQGQSPFFVDVVVAPGYEDGVVGYIEGKSKNIRIAEYSGIERLPRFRGDETYGLVSLKQMPGGYIGVQDTFLTDITSPADLILRPQVTRDGQTYTIEYEPTSAQASDLVDAVWLNIAGARSNGIVGVKDGTTVAVGAGQVARIEAFRFAIIKGMQKAWDRAGIEYDPLLGIYGWEERGINPLEGSSFSSDAFCPFDDSVRALGRMNVAALAQPYGSNLDHLSIIAANEHKMAMPATLERCFGHW